MKKYFKIWKQLADCSISSYLTNRIESFSYFIGKAIRFLFFLFLIFSIFKFKNNIAGYGKYEAIMFYLTLNLMDVLSQSFMRGIYMFKGDVSQGEFDNVLSKPVNPLFYIMMRVTDILDIVFLIPIILLIIYIIPKLPMSISLAGLAAYILFIITGLIIILSIHILSAGITIITVENDNFIWFYRELLNTGRFPPEIYSPFMQFILTFIMPIIVIIAFPVKALFGLIDFAVFAEALSIALIFFAGSLAFWRFSLKRYSSASS